MGCCLVPYLCPPWRVLNSVPKPVLIFQPPTVLQTPEVDYGNHRSAFPALQNKRYFNYGGQGPLPWGSLGAIAKAYTQLQEIGPFSSAANGWGQTIAQQLRIQMAGEFSVHPDTITLTENVSVGCNIALWGLPWQAGDHILLTDCEHPGIVAVIQELQRRFDLRVSTVALLPLLNSGDPVQAILKGLQNNTRLVVLSHVLWNTGHVLPLREIVQGCQKAESGRYPVRLLVDAAQSVGSQALNLQDLGVDFYAFTGHKWWCGPEGVGGLYVRPGVRDELQPTFAAWRGIVEDESGKPTGWKDNGQRYEVATSAYPLYAGLLESLRVHQAWGSASQRYERLRSLGQSLWQQLQTIPGITCLQDLPPTTGIVSFQVADRDPQDLVQYLEAQQILVRKIRNPACVRACTHYLTTEEEVAQLVAAVQSFVGIPG